ncbi:MAG: hypothetical protein A3I92_02225 [Candidatus Yanofskybacteria bacterium RIFCSPLOWO2_02_FULL_43_10b]|uniref:Fibronectin type-III domain-containing protein n=1 Tax=Candidatus Yanofskybacteria bacterium RIFCSPLOWO2_02_FULL_43_10b TaxID=1802704 RepID=A0A1F8H3U8_9BACT|nr:MAG: hypothetical protein A3I92_02225 [Candidatus Yanofskybacteria bacterium RIFCSPLOWO2_02_FULL_43_10b]
MGSFDVTPPASPKLKRTVEADGQIILEWVNPNDSDFVRVVVVQKEGIASTQLSDGSAIVETDQTSHIAANLTNGKIYYFALYALDLSRNVSLPLIFKATPKQDVLSFPEKVSPVEIAKSTTYVPSLATAVSAGQGRLFPSGTLVRNLFDKDVYLIEKNYKRLVADYRTLLKLTNNHPDRVIVAPLTDILISYPASASISEKDALSFKLSSILLKSKDRPQIYLVDPESKTKKPIPDLAIFYSYGFSFKQVTETTMEDLDKYSSSSALPFLSLPNGSLFKSFSDPKVYILHNGQKRWIKTYQIFQAYKLDFAKVADLPKEVVEAYASGMEVQTVDEKLPAYSNGSLLRSQDDYKIYLFEENRLRWITTLAVFKARGHSFEKVVVVSPEELKGYGKGEDISR